MHWFLKIIFGIKLYMFRTVSLSIIRSFSLYTQQNLYGIYYSFEYSEKTSDDGQRNCPKHAEFYSKNNFEKSVHLVRFIIRISTCIKFHKADEKNSRAYSKYEMTIDFMHVFI